MTAKPALLIFAALSTAYAAVAFFLGFDSDFLVSGIVALLALGAVFYLDHQAHELARAREWRRHIEESADWELDDDDCLREVD